MKRALPAAFVAAITFALPAFAADDPILSRLAGEWTGGGTYKQSADAAQERIFCKVTNTLVQNGTALEQRGRCSVASGSGPIDGTITAAGGGRYSGTLMSLASEGPASFSGSGGGGRLTLSMTFVDPAHPPSREGRDHHDAERQRLPPAERAQRGRQVVDADRHHIHAIAPPAPLARERAEQRSTGATAWMCWAAAAEVDRKGRN